MLSKIKLPSELGGLSEQELYSLSDEIREKIIEVTSKNGGHLASNLGVVELTVAIHAALQSPKDKIIWDVGHQCYAHKILTGRLNKFPTIRQYRGLSGFTKREESLHDPFGAGHAATSISAALGIAKARDIKGENFAVLSVIGDSSISSGEAFEAINNIKTVKGPFIIILNDNEMSISHPVGMLSDHITSLRYNHLYRGFKKDVEGLLLRMPTVGRPLVTSIDKLLRRTKHLLINYEKIGVIYEEFGIRYLGPIDATNIAHIMGAICYAKTAKEPVLIHVLSKKGLGYKPAEEDPTTYHGLGKFDKKTGKELKRQTVSYTKVFGDKLLELAKNDEKIVAISAAMAEGTGLCDFKKTIPERFVDVGISEEHAVTFAAGIATQGLKPVVAIYSTFMQRAYDQIIHDIALQDLPVVLAMDRGGLVGEDGPTHHGVFDLAFMRSIPNFTVMSPKDAKELEDMLVFAIKHNGAVSSRYPRGEVPNIKMPESQIKYGKAELLIENQKANVCVVAIGSMVEKLFAVITEHKLNIKLINARFLKPLDEAILLKEFKNMKHVFTFEEGIKEGGLYSAVAELVTKGNLPLVLHGRGLGYNEFITHGSKDELFGLIKLDNKSILKELKEYL